MALYVSAAKLRSTSAGVTNALSASAAIYKNGALLEQFVLPAAAAENGTGSASRSMILPTGPTSIPSAVPYFTGAGVIIAQCRRRY